MKENFLWYLGFLGALGLLGLITDNPGFYGFFGFFGFFAYRKIIFDERFKENVNKAAKNAFLSAIIFYPLVTTYAVFTSSFASVYSFAFAINFALQIIIFSFSLSYYER
ncbi:Protein of unknown function [Desulfotomaculum arcticum]|uniref:DUF3796 domain-containing protein n=1 Tax=Desulfotruncus arcticus DSM 17038 TaxID=1121424 RepID=A0A1I2PEJ3_9FIRM|nr:DUF3796 domain-containing protein [Desulfotruncus arcticus]SFG12076.1 Protein of unknown function [Desulfotomaculum arcticum] [Desulfotruncus arcticus DSM 17038]